MIIGRVVWLGCAGLMLCSCAAPRWEGAAQPFVSVLQVGAVQLATDAKDLFKHRRYVDAEHKLRQALYLEPADNLTANLAEALSARGEFGESISIYRGLLKAAPQSLDYNIGLGRALFESGDLQASRQVLEKSLADAVCKKNVEASKKAALARSLAVVNFKAGWEEDALCYSQLALSFESGPIELSRHVRLLVATGFLPTAEELLVGYFDADGAKQDAALLHTLAMIRFSQDHYQEAAGLERRALDAARSPTANGAENRPEMLLVKSLSERLLNAQSGASVQDAVSLEEQLPKPATPDLNEALPVLNSQNPYLTLYWPEKLLQEYQKSVAKEEAARVGAAQPK